MRELIPKLSLSASLSSTKDALDLFQLPSALLKPDRGYGAVNDSGNQDRPPHSRYP